MVNQLKDETMSIKRNEPVGKFSAIDDDGKICTVVVWQQIIDAPSQDDPEGEVPGMKCHKLDDGSKLIRLDDNTFQSFSDGRIFHRRK